MKSIKLVLIILFSITIASCGGGGGGGGTPSVTPGTISGKVTLSGTAAQGAAIVNATITFKDKNGSTQTATTGTDGKYSIDVTGKTAPFLLQVPAKTGGYLYSVATATGTANIHPFTDLIIRNWYKVKGADLDIVFGGTGALSSVPTVSEISTIEAVVRSILSTWFSKEGLDATTFDLITSSFNADHTGFDKVLDNTGVVIDTTGNVTVTTADPNTGIKSTMVTTTIATDLTTTDTTKPSDPTGLSVIPASATSVVLVWNASTDNVGVAGYNIYRDGSKIGTSPYPLYSDTGLTSSSYCHQVEAFDGAGNVSANKSSSVCSTPVADTTPPSTPTGLTATVVSASQIDLSWTASTDNVSVAGYAIYRNGSKVAAVSGTNYSDTGLSSGNLYTYTVQALDGALNYSAASNTASATTQAGIPSAPAGLTATAGNGQVTISWNAVSGATSYNLYMATQSGVTKSYYATLTGGMTHPGVTSPYIHTGLTNGTAYYFVVTAANASGESVESSEVSATPVVPASDTTPPTTNASPAGGTYATAQNVTLTCNDGTGTGCGSIYYTTDGSTPTTASTVYSSSISVSATTTLKFFAKDVAGNSEAVKTESYTIAALASTWATKTSMPTARAGVSAAELNGLLYVVGGYGSVELATLEVYNPVTDTWTTKTPMSVARHGLAVGFINGLLYVAGGYNAGSKSTLEVYDPMADTWTTKTSMPTAREGQGAVVNGILYVVGGNASGSCSSVVEAYNPATDTWTSKTSMPTPRCNLGVVAGNNGLIYAIGGGDTGGTINYTTIEAYDPATNTWSTKAPMPTGRQAFGASMVNGFVYAVGGNYGVSGSYLTSVEAYDPVTNTWSTKDPMPTARNSPVSGVVNGILYAVGGINNSNVVIPTNEAYTPPSTNSNTWATKASMPVARYLSSGAGIGNLLYAVGGYNNCVPYSALEAYDPVTDTWTAKASIPTGRWWSGSAAVNGILYVVGGANNCSSPNPGLTTVEAYNPVTDTWATKAAMPTPRYGLAVGAVNNIIYAVGGYSNTSIVNTVEAYDTAANTWTAKAPLQTARAEPGIGAVNGILYVVGGGDASGALNSVEAYNPATNTWSYVAPLTTGRSALGVSVVNGILYAVGGNLGTGTRVATAEAYNPATNTWTAVTAMPTARQGLFAGVVNNIIYAVGGSNSSGVPLATVEAYTP